VPNALARSSRDFILEDDEPRSGSRAVSTLNFILRRPVEVAGVVAISGLTVAILVNALALQTESHPSPFFPRASLMGPDRDPARQRTSRETTASLPERSPLIESLQAALVARGLYDGQPDGLFGPRTQAAIRAYQEKVRLEVDGRPSEALLARLKTGSPVVKVTTQSIDPIAGLIKSTSAAPPSPPNKRLMAVEQALADLGYGPVRIDGVMDAATRDAIARFERDRALEPTGAMSPRLLRELASVADLAIE
jgi:peptidoglycan hydrolase-like protein with peptidoglycan-binding domain